MENGKWKTNLIRVVDDKRIFINTASTGVQDTNIAIKYLQQASQYWQYLLYTTGGKLQYSKFVFYVIKWKFKNDEITTMNENIDYTLLIISSETRDITQIKHKRCTQVFAYVGYTSRSDRNQYPQYKIYLTKTKSLA